MERQKAIYNYFASVMKPLFKLFYNFDLSGLENYHLYSAGNGEWVLFNLKKENVLVLQLPNFNSKITKEATFLTYFINKAKKSSWWRNDIWFDQFWQVSYEITSSKIM